MKISAAALLFTLVGSATAIGPMRATAGLLKHARKLEDQNNNQNDDQEEEEYSFLANYQLKLLTCKSGETYVNPEDGEYESSSVVFRLCPKDSCDDESFGGCSDGYGDYVVGINTFVQGYLEDKKEDMQQDDNFNVDEFGECREYEADQDADDENGNNGNQAQYYVGPACSEDGTDIVLDMFTDYICSVKSEVTFEEISNGLSLPYTDGGLVSNYCESCSGYNDNGEYELSEMCMRLYEDAGKCESGMEYFHYSGQNEASCEFIESMLPKSKRGGAGKVFGWIFFCLVIIGAVAVGYSVMKKKRGENDKSFGLMSS